MLRRLLVIIACLLAKVCLLVLPLSDIASTVLGSAKESVTPMAAWTGLLALGLAVYFVCSALVDLLWAVAAWLGRELMDEFRFDWRRVLMAVTAVLVVLHPLRAWQYLLGMIGQNELTETALLVDAQNSSNHHLLAMAFAVLVAVALPPLRVFIRKEVKTWQSAVALVFLLGLAAWVLPPTSRPLRGWAINVAQVGNREVLVGTQGWLFDRRELDALTGHARDLNKVSKTVLGFAMDLKDRGVPLLLIPLPMKTSIYPEVITGADPDESPAPLYHARQPDLYAEWTKAGIDVQDITSAMMQAKEKKMPVFLRQSSFWTPEAMQVLAKAIAGHVRKTYPTAAAPSPLNVDVRTRDGVGFGRLVEALDQAGPGGAFKPERLVLLSFPSIESDPKSDIVLLGGTEVTLFDDQSLGYVPPNTVAGSTLHAGFAQHLALYLGKALDVHARPHGAATDCRQEFAQELDDQVRAKRLVIWLLPVTDLLLPRPNNWQPAIFNPAQSAPESLHPMVPGQK